MIYPIQPGSSFPGSKLGKLPNPVALAGEYRPVQTSHWPFSNSNSSLDTWGNLSNLWIPCKESQLNINKIHSTCLAQAQLYVTSKIGYVDAMLLFRPRHLALNSPLGHFNGDQLTPLHQTHENHGDSKVHFPPTATWLSLNYSEHNPSHVRRHTLPSQPSQPSHKSISSPYSLSYSPRVLQHKKQTQYSMLQIKTIPKNTFRLSASYFIILPLFTLKIWRGD